MEFRSSGGGLRKLFAALMRLLVTMHSLANYFWIMASILPLAVQIIPKVWVERLSKPTSEATLHWAYGAQIWHPYPDTYMMAGLHGQFIYIQPIARVVIVKLSDEPTINQDPALYTVPVLHEIAENGT